MIKARSGKAVLCVLLCVSLLCGCGVHQVERVQERAVIYYSWWGKDDHSERVIQGIDAFENSFADISVKPEYGEFEGFKSRMDSEFYSDTQADVMQLNYDWLYEYSPDGEQFYDLNELSEYIDLSNFSEFSLELGTVNDKLNALPYSINAVTFVYNQNFYDSYGLDLPQTWEDLFAAAKVMRSDEVYPLALSEKNFWMCCCAYMEQTTGHSVFDKENNFTLAQSDLEIMIDFYQRLVNEKVSKLGAEFDRNDFQDCITGGVATWNSDAGYFSDAAEKYGFNIVVGDYPAQENYKSYGWYVKPTSLLAVKKSTKEPEAAAKLLDFILNSSDMAALVGTTKGVPVSRSATETLAARDMLTGIGYISTQKINDTPELEIMSPYLENSQLISIFTDACESVYYGKMKTSTAAKRSLEKMSELF